MTTGGSNSRAGTARRKARTHTDRVQRHGLARMLLVTAVLAAGIPTAGAQENTDALAKKLANPVASLISVPFQYNVDYGFGSEDGSKQTLNIQPVIPTSISTDWNLISRIITPVVYQDDLFGDSGSQSGLGDITPTFFFSPKEPTAGGLVWGAGPVFLLPTATDDLLGAEQWGIGPSAVFLKQTPTGYTYGLLMNHIWSVAGEDDRADVSNTFFQPFLARNFPGGRTLTVNFESSYNWETDQATVPFNVTYAKVTRVGDQLISLQGGVRVYLDSPPGGPDWGLRFGLTLLFPR